MKITSKKLICAISAASILSFGINAFAETVKSPARIKAETEIKKRAAEVKNAPKITSLPEKTDIEKRIGKKLDAERTKIANKYEEGIKNLNAFALRIESLMTKMSERGIDTTRSKALLDVAKAKISVAETSLGLLETNLSSSVTGLKRANILKESKTLAEKTKSDIKSAHASLVGVITSLKPGLQKQDN